MSETLLRARLEAILEGKVLHDRGEDDARAWGGRRRIARRAARAELGARAGYCARRTAAAEQHPDRRVDVQQPEDHQAGGEQVEGDGMPSSMRARRALFSFASPPPSPSRSPPLVAVPLREVVRRQRERHAEEHVRLEERGLNAPSCPYGRAGRLRADAASEKGRGGAEGADLRARTWKSALSRSCSRCQRRGR